MDKKKLAVIIVIAVLALAVVVESILLIRGAGKKDGTTEETQTEAASGDEGGVKAQKPENKLDGTGDAKLAETKESEAKETETKETNTTDKTDTTTTNTNTNTTAGTQTQPAADGYTLTYDAGNGWQDGDVSMYGVQWQITNNAGTAVDGWNLNIEIEGLARVDGWNGTYNCNGNTLSISNAEYNGGIANGANTIVGCNLGVKASSFTVKSATLNGVPCTIQTGVVDQNAQNEQNNQNNNNGQAAVDVDALLERSADAVQGDDWLHTDGRKILDSKGKEVWITGVNWFGYNTGTNTFDGLWNSQLVPTVKAIADHGFNLIRVPMSAQLLNEWAAGTYPKANYNNAYNSELNSMNSLEIFDYFLSLAEANGIKVMIDIHSAETNASGHNVNLWYTDKVSTKEYLAALAWAAERYKDNDTIVAFDLKNEPHGKPAEGNKAAIWNDSKSDNNWKYVAEQAALTVLQKNPNVLVMVEGIEIYPMDIKSNSDYHSTSEDDYYFNWWGGNLRGVKDYPLELGKYQDKLVYSPHDYGPTVYEQPWFKGNYTYDSLMEDCWGDNWFYIYEDNIAPLLIGEWGGFMRDPNLTWMTYMRQLIKTYKLNHTFWCLNANSGDTGGLLLDDFITWDEDKYGFVKEVLWQKNGKFVGLDHAIPLGDNGISLSEY